MGTPQPTMAATQILVALCVVGSAVAAPQLSLGRSRSAGPNINENQVVTSVITSLTPSISKTLLTRKSALTLVPWLTQFTTLNTKWRTMRRKLTSQGTRRETAMSFPDPTPSLTQLEHWSLSTTLPV